MAPKRRRAPGPPADHPLLLNLRNKLAIRWYLDSQAPSFFVRALRPTITSSKMSPSVMEAQKLKSPGLKVASPFYRTLEERLDKRHAAKRMLTVSTPRDTVDFSSTDFLSLSSSGLVRLAYFDELARHPGFQLSSGGAPMLNGKKPYIETLEQELADFHGAEKGLMFSSGYDASGTIYKVIPREGDAIVFDENVHTSIHDGLRNSRASISQSFLHNDLASFREVLTLIKESDEDFEDGERTVLISIESVYDMDGDIAPVEEMVRIAKEIFPLGNARFIVDEAHSTGLIGEKGTGLVCALGLEKEIAIRLHTFGKALGSHGAIVLCNDTIRSMLANYTRCLIYSTVPSFSTLAAIRGGYNLMKSGLTQERQETLQHLLRHFYKTLHANPVCGAARAANILSIPRADSYENERFLTHVVPICTREGENHLLAAHLQLADYCAWPIDHPAVLEGQGRVRLVFHATNTEAEVDELVSLICAWAKEVLDEEAELAKLQGSLKAVHVSGADKMVSFEKADWNALFQQKATVVTGVRKIDPEDSSSGHTTTPEEMLPEEMEMLPKCLSGGTMSPAEMPPGLWTGDTATPGSSMGETVSPEDALPEIKGKLRRASFALEAWQQQLLQKAVLQKAGADVQLTEVLFEMEARH